MVAPVSFQPDDSSNFNSDESISSFTSQDFGASSEACPDASSTETSPTDAPSEASPTCSARKRRANQRNARKSTGPRTPEGKQRSSKNATTLGLFCADLLLPGENPELLEHLRNTMLLELNPRTMTQLMLADRVISCAWRLRRIFPAEQMLACAATFNTTVQKEVNTGRIPSYFEDPDDIVEDPHYFHKLVKKHLRKTELGEGVALASMLLGPQAAAMERLGRYEQRLVNQSNRALAELRKLQSDKNHKNTSSDNYVDELFEEGMCPFVSGDFLNGLKIQIQKLKDLNELLTNPPSPEDFEDEDKDGVEDEEEQDDDQNEADGETPATKEAEPTIVKNEATGEKTAATEDQPVTYGDEAMQENAPVEPLPASGQSESPAAGLREPEETA